MFHFGFTRYGCFDHLSFIHSSTVEDGQKISKKILGEHKEITPEQQFDLNWLLQHFHKKKAIAKAILNA